MLLEILSIFDSTFSLSMTRVFTLSSRVLIQLLLPYHDEIDPEILSKPISLDFDKSLILPTRSLVFFFLVTCLRPVSSIVPVLTREYAVDSSDSDPSWVKILMQFLIRIVFWVSLSLCTDTGVMTCLCPQS